MATNGEEVEVRKEDQDRINRFSRLHQRETLLEEKLKTKQVRRPLSFEITRSMYSRQHFKQAICILRGTNI